MNSKFWIGFWTYGCISSLIKDFYGKEYYLQLVDQKWIDSKYTIPIAGTALAFLIIQLWKKNER